MAKKLQPEVYNIGTVARHIYDIRGQKVMLDADLATLYGVETKNLIRGVKRNITRFPADFMFQLDKDEWANLRCQIGTSSSKHGGRRYAPFVFTEHGAIMLSSILNSPQATEVSVLVVRAFVWLRETIPGYKELVDKVAELETKIDSHDSDITMIIEAVKRLVLPQNDSEKRRIGF